MAPVIETDIVLRDGSTVHVRPTTDRGRAAAARVPRFALGALAVVPLLQRGRRTSTMLPAAPRRRATGCRCSRCARATVVGHGTYIREAPDRAEVAFAVADAWHGHGIATVLLAHLAHAAAGEGIETFTASGACRRTTGCSGCSTTPASRSPRTRSEGEIAARVPDVAVARSATSASRSASATADVAAVAHVLRPASVAVIGASDARAPSAVRSCATCAPAGFARPLHRGR